VTGRLVAPDTGIVLAQALGPEVDAQAARAVQSLDQTVAADVPVLLLPSVDAELTRKLAELNAIYELVREAYQRLPAEQPADAGLASAEALVVRVRRAAGGRLPRYVATFEAEFVRRGWGPLRHPSRPSWAMWSRGSVFARKRFDGRRGRAISNFRANSRRRTETGRRRLLAWTGATSSTFGRPSCLGLGEATW
jgi:hypothetical protein